MFHFTTQYNNSLLSQKGQNTKSARKMWTNMRRLCAWLSRVGRRLMKVILHAFQQTHWEKLMEKYRPIVSILSLNAYSFSNSILRLVLLVCYKILQNTLIFDVNSSLVCFWVFLRAKECFFSNSYWSKKEFWTNKNVSPLKKQNKK